MATSAARQQVLKLAGRRQGLRAREIIEAGLHTQILTRLVAEGQLERTARGIYRRPDKPPTEHYGLVMVSVTVPHGVICLLSALQFHGIGTQNPWQVWVAVDRRSRRPSLKYPPLRVVRFSGDALTQGIETHRLQGRPVRVYNVAKTIADCFKYRNKIGLDVAMEALREAWRDRRVTMEALEQYARICRVQRVMRPYLEALVA